MLELVKSLSNIVLVSTRSLRIPITSLHMETMLSGYCEVLGAKCSTCTALRIERNPTHK